MTNWRDGAEIAEILSIRDGGLWQWRWQARVTSSTNVMVAVTVVCFDNASEF